MIATVYIKPLKKKHFPSQLPRTRALVEIGMKKTLKFAFGRRPQGN